MTGKADFWPNDEPIAPWAMAEATNCTPHERIEKLVAFWINEHTSDEPDDVDDDVFAIRLKKMQDSADLATGLLAVMSEEDVVLAEIDYDVWMYHYGRPSLADLLDVMFCRKRR